MAAILEYRLTGGATNTDPNASLGGVMSSTGITDGVVENLFDNITPDEASAGDTEYRAIDIYNSGDATATSVALYISSETPSAGTQIDLGVETSNSPHASDAALPTIPDESTEPTDGTAPVAFTHATSASKISLVDIPAGEATRIWIRRTVAASTTNLSGDNATISVEFA